MFKDQGNEGMEVGALLGVLRRRAWVIVACIIATAGVALAVSTVQRKSYLATATLLIRDLAVDPRLSGSAVSLSREPAREVETNLRLVKLGVVADRAAKRLNGQFSPSEISASVTVANAPDSDVLEVNAVQPWPRAAARTANAFADAYVDFRRDSDASTVTDAVQVIEAKLEENPPKRERRDLETQLIRLRNLQSSLTGNVELVQRAQPPGSPSSPKPKRNAIIGGFAGLLIGLALAIAIEQRDRRWRRPEELAEALNLPVLGTVPESGLIALEGNVLRDPFSPEAEAFRMLRTNLRYFEVSREVKSLLVTSAAPRDGKSTIALNLAAAAAEVGTKTLLLEADIRRPTFAQVLGLSDDRGLTTLLTGEHGEISEVTQPILVTDRANGRPTPDPEGRPQLDILVAGPVPPNPTDLIESDRMRWVMESAMAHYEFVVVDTAPATIIPDVIPLLKMVSGVVVVGRLGGGERDASLRLRDQLERLNAPTLGVVANFASTAGFSSYYSYYGSPHRQ